MQLKYFLHNYLILTFFFIQCPQIAFYTSMVTVQTGTAEYFCQNVNTFELTGVMLSPF